MTEPKPKRDRLARLVRPTLTAGVLVLVAGLAAAPELLALHPTGRRATAPLLAPGATDSGGLYLLGTDADRRDFLSVLVRGVRFSLLMATFGTALVVAGAVGWGVMAGVSRSWPVAVVTGAAALAVMGLPDLVVLATLRGLWPWERGGWSSHDLASASNLTVATAAAVLATPAVALLVADRVRTLDASPAARATREIGAGTVYLVRREHLPHLRPVLAWIVGRKFPFFVALEATLDLLSLPYRNASGLGACLAECWRQAHTPVGQVQLAATVAAVVALCLAPQLLFGLSAGRTGGTHD